MEDRLISRIIAPPEKNKELVSKGTELFLFEKKQKKSTLLIIVIWQRFSGH